MEEDSLKTGFDKKDRKKGPSGRPNALNDEQLVDLLNTYYTRAVSLRDLADMYGVSRMTVWRLVQRYEPLAV